MSERSEQIFIIVICLVLFIEFLYINPFGIKLGYVLSGGKTTSESSLNLDELRRDYNESVSTYYMYKDSDNTTAAQWAETAKQKANDIAKQYNEIMNENILGEIG